MPQKNRIFIGTSGWLYKGWYEAFYPADVKKNHLLFFSKHFNSAELNASFYRLPLPTSFEKWQKETPPEFLFAVKLSRYITHVKRLLDPAEPVRNFLANAAHLKHKLGVVLIQLPPSFRYDLPRLAELVGLMRETGKEFGIRPLRLAFEPRHKSWFEAPALEGTRKLFRKNNVAMVLAESSRFPNYAPKPDNLTANFAYFRFHGPREFAASEYKKRGLRPWAEKIRSWHEAGIGPVFAYFNNDIHGYAIKDAKALMELLGIPPPAV